MAVSKLNLLSEFLRRNTGAKTGKGASELRAEKKLGVKFPKSFREYLNRFGFISHNADEFYGLDSDIPNHLDLVRNTEGERTQFQPNLPLHLIPFLPNGGGDHYCIDLRSGDDPKVVFWNHELGPDQKPEVIASAFSTWLLQHYDDEG
jgi:cell wall assembly regulator SMI1